MVVENEDRTGRVQGASQYVIVPLVNLFSSRYVSTSLVVHRELTQGIRGTEEVAEEKEKGHHSLVECNWQR